MHPRQARHPLCARGTCRRGSLRAHGWAGAPATSCAVRSAQRRSPPSWPAGLACAPRGQQSHTAEGTVGAPTYPLWRDLQRGAAACAWLGGGTGCAVRSAQRRRPPSPSAGLRAAVSRATPRKGSPVHPRTRALCASLAARGRCARTAGQGRRLRRRSARRRRPPSRFAGRGARVDRRASPRVVPLVPLRRCPAPAERDLPHGVAARTAGLGHGGAERRARCGAPEPAQLVCPAGVPYRGWDFRFIGARHPLSGTGRVGSLRAHGWAGARPRSA